VYSLSDTWITTGGKGVVLPVAFGPAVLAVAPLHAVAATIMAPITALNRPARTAVHLRASTHRTHLDSASVNNCSANSSIGPMTVDRERSPHRRGEGGLLRDELVATAAGLLSRAAQPGDVSLRSVASALGVSPGAVYLWFQDRDALMEAATRALFAELHATLQEAAQRRRTPATRLEAIALAYAEFALERPAAYAAMINDAEGDWGLLGRDELPGVESLALVEAELAQLPTVIPAERAALLLWSALHGQIQLRRGVPQLPWPPVADSVRELVRLVVRAR